MVDHCLAIHHFRTRLALTGLPEDGPPVVRDLGRTVREVLPAAIGRALEPLLGGRDGVLRIDRVAVRLRLTRGELSAPAIADLLAREIARLVATRADTASPGARIGSDLAFWPDHASYAASYVAMRLRLAAAPDWAFPDFRALDHLAGHEAALELCAARPVILASLARLIGAAGAPILAASMPEAAATRLIERLAADVSVELVPRVQEDLALMIAAIPEAAEIAPARAALGTIVAVLASGAASETRVRETAMLARAAVALRAAGNAARAWGRKLFPADLAPESLPSLPQPARRLVRAAITPLSRSAEARAALVRLLVQGPPRAGPAEHPAGNAGKSVLLPRAIASRNAGIGLLMPAALACDLPALLSPAALHYTLVAALGPEIAQTARLDPLLAALAPFDPRGPEPVFPPIPESLRAAVPEEHRDGAAASEGAAGWAACLTHAFAAGLRGFEISSLPYLRRQFLARPGTLHLAKGQLTLVLDPLPLGIVLRLSGFNGWTGRLPQPGNPLLRIEIREG